MFLLRFKKIVSELALLHLLNWIIIIFFFKGFFFLTGIILTAIECCNSVSFHFNFVTQSHFRKCYNLVLFLLML